MKEKIKPIVITDGDNGDVFTLEFNRESVRFAEMKGFNISDIETKPMSTLPELFYYAFRMHHKSVSKDKADKIYEKLGGLTEAMVARLGALYAAPFETLIQSEESLKNSNMTVEM